MVAFGISFGSATPLLRREDTRKFMDLVKMADDFGATALGTFDTAFIGGDAYVRATLMAQASARARVGLRPTNPLTREPQIMASFLASIDTLTDGRAFMDIASGDSAVHEGAAVRSEEHTSELQSHHDLVCRLLLEKKKNKRAM